MAPYYNCFEATHEPYPNIEIFEDYILHQRRFNNIVSQTFEKHVE
jgi:hypothetical protein